MLASFLSFLGYFQMLNLSTLHCCQSAADWCWAIPFFHAGWSLGPLPDCKCGTIKQTADHVLTACPIACIEYDQWQI